MPKLIANTAKMPHDEWLELRKQGIGGSEAAAVAGVSQYANPVTLYMQKKNLYEPQKSDYVKGAAEWGNILEPVIREKFKKEINSERELEGLKPLRIVHRQAIFAHDEHQFIRTNLDGQVFGHEKGNGILEIKTASEYVKGEWDGEDVPNAYFVQCQHNMLVMDAPFAYLAVLIGGNKYKHYFIERDHEFCDYLIQIESYFWNNNILANVPPEMDGADSEKEMMNALYPDSNEYADRPPTNLPSVCIEYVEQIDALKRIQDELKQEQQRFENEVKAMMGDNETAFAGTHKVTWKTASNGTRTFRLLLDAETHKNKFYETRLKGIVKERKEVEKKIKAVIKERKAIEKELKKQQKEAEKAEKEALKKAKAELKQQTKELEEIK